MTGRAAKGSRSSYASATASTSWQRVRGLAHAERVTIQVLHVGTDRRPFARRPAKRGAGGAVIARRRSRPRRSPQQTRGSARPRSSTGTSRPPSGAPRLPGPGTNGWRRAARRTNRGRRRHRPPVPRRRRLGPLSASTRRPARIASHHVERRHEVAQALAGGRRPGAPAAPAATAPTVDHRPAAGRWCARQGPSAGRSAARCGATRRISSSASRSRGGCRGGVRAGSGGRVDRRLGKTTGSSRSLAASSSVSNDARRGRGYADSAARRSRRRWDSGLVGSSPAQRPALQGSTTRASSRVERCSCTQIPPSPTAAAANETASPRSPTTCASCQSCSRASASRPAWRRLATSATVSAASTLQASSRSAGRDRSRPRRARSRNGFD